MIKKIYLNTCKTHTPHVVMGIDTKNNSFSNWKNNSIIIKDFSFYTTNDKINLCDYQKYVFGKNVCKSIVNNNGIINIDISRIKNNFVIIVTQFNDVIKKQFPTLMVIPKQSNYIILAIATVDVSMHTAWDNNYIIAQSKLLFTNKNCKTTNHFGTKGKVYSFGLHGLYRKIMI